MVDEYELRGRLVNTLLSQGFQIHTYRIIDQSSAVVTWAEGTDEVAANAALDAFDWTEAAHTAWTLDNQKAAAKLLLSAHDAMPLATRGACYGNMLTAQETRAKINEILAALQSGDPAAIMAVEPLVTGDTLESALIQVGQIIDAGMVTL